VLDIIDKDKRELAELVATICGLKEPLEANKRAREDAAEKRKDAKKERGKIIATLSTMEMPPPDTPDEEISMEEMMAKVREAEAQKQTNKERREQLNKQLDSHEGCLAETDRRIFETNTEIKELKEALKEQEQTLEALRTEQRGIRARWEEDLPKIKEELEGIVDPDLDALNQQIANADKVNKDVRLKKRIGELTDAMAHADVVVEQLEADVKEWDEARKRILASADLPGLNITDDGVTVNGVHFDGLSGAEHIEFAVEILTRANPRLKSIIIPNGEAYDEDELDHAKRYIVSKGYQPIIIRVGKGEECDIIIESGEVAEVRGNNGAETGIE